MIIQNKEETILKGKILDIVCEIVTLIDSISKNEDYKKMMITFKLLKELVKEDDLIIPSKIEYVENMITSYKEKFNND